MTVDTMRVIDYYVGVPLCALASLWLRLVNFFSFSRSIEGKPKRVAFLELSEMGSTILADSALRWTKEQGAEIYFVIFKRNVGSLKLLGTVPEKNFFLIRENNLWIFAWDSLQYLLWCRRTKIDAIVDLELFSRYTSLLTAFSGARERIGFHAFHNEGLYRGEVLTRKVAYNPHIHIAKNFMALVKSLFEDGTDVPFYKGEIKDSEIPAAQSVVTESAKGRVTAALGKYAERPEQVNWVLLNCAGGEFLPQRRWPVPHYAKLAQMILDRHPNTKILLTGSPAERDEVDPIRVRASRDNLINFAGDILFEDLTALYTMSKVLISNDSGPAHFASTTQIPTYVFFGPETPKLYGALGENFTPIYAHFACSPCVTAFNHRKTPCEDNRCLQVITPEQVYEMVRPCLG
ncbi:MAG: glycosyltransferase family 9 protein [Bdellovibrionaceae bacterium]|nr:glycosyltransferase family 9 protein [Pseudobdellovibrionaceae bacterium]